MLLKEDPTLFPQHLKNSLLNLGLIDKETCTLSTLNTVIFRANKVWFLCWILSELPPAAATNKQIVGSVSGSILVNIPNVCSLAERSRIIHFLSTLPDHFDVEVGDRKFHLVHAMPSDDPDDRIWRRPKPDDPPYFEDRIAVVGHTPTCYMSGDMESPFAVWHGNGLIDIDCGCGNKTELRRLACLRLDDLKEFYI